MKKDINNSTSTMTEDTAMKKENMFIKAMKIVGKIISAPFVGIYKAIRWVIKKISSIFNHSKKVDDSMENNSEENNQSTQESNQEVPADENDEMEEAIYNLVNSINDEENTTDDEASENETDDESSENEETTTDDEASENEESEKFDFIDFKTTPEKTAKLSECDPYDKLKPILLSGLKTIDEFVEATKKIGFVVKEAKRGEDGKFEDVVLSYPEKRSSELRCFYDITSENVPIMVMFYSGKYQVLKKSGIKSMVSRLNVPMDASMGKENGQYDGFTTAVYYGPNESLVSIGISKDMSAKEYFICISVDR